MSPLRFLTAMTQKTFTLMIESNLTAAEINSGGETEVQGVAQIQQEQVTVHELTLDLSNLLTTV